MFKRRLLHRGERCLCGSVLILDVPVHLRPATGGHARAPLRGIGGTVGGQAGRHRAHDQISMPWGPSWRSCMNTGPSLSGTPTEQTEQTDKGVFKLLIRENALPDMEAP